MISRRQFIRWLGLLGAVGATTLGYAVFEPLMRPRTTRYDLRPGRWGVGGVVADWVGGRDSS